MAEAAEGLALRVRRGQSQQWPDMDALAKAWEASGEIRECFRANSAHLLCWPSPTLVGAASLKALGLNVTVIRIALTVWGSSTPLCKAMAIDWLKQEATLLTVTLLQLLHASVSIESYWELASLIQVYSLHKLLNPMVSHKSVALYVDAWGVKRLSTLAMRRWKAPIASLRDARSNSDVDDVVFCSHPCERGHSMELIQVQFGK